jgi:hypothetical protein
MKLRCFSNLESLGTTPFPPLQSFFEYTENSSLGPKLAFPKPYDFPTSRTQQAIYGQITLTVTDDLASPVSLIGFRRPIALRTAVPEAAIDENSNLMPRKDKIRFPRQGIAPAPADETGGANNSDKPQLSCLVRLRPNSRHVRRSFRPGKLVHDRNIRIDLPEG